MLRLINFLFSLRSSQTDDDFTKAWKANHRVILGGMLLIALVQGSVFFALNGLENISTNALLGPASGVLRQAVLLGAVVVSACLFLRTLWAWGTLVRLGRGVGGEA